MPARDPRELFRMEETMRTLRPEKQRRGPKIAVWFFILSVAGTHTIMYTAADAAGNIGTATRTYDQTESSRRAAGHARLDSYQCDFHNALV